MYVKVMIKPLLQLNRWQLSRQISILLCLLSLCSLAILSGCQNNIPQKNHITHLTLWQGINPPANRDVFQKLVTKFNQTHPNIQVDSLFILGSDMALPKILTSVVGNATPDLLVYNPGITGQIVELDAVTPLDQWWNQFPHKSEVFPNLLEQLKLNGKLWSLPLWNSNVGIFYRPDLFEAAGITQTPKTWEELIAVAQKLTLDKNGDGHPEQYGILLPLGKGGWTVFTWFPFVLSAGGGIMTDNYPNLNNPAAITAIKFWQQLLQTGVATLSPPERGYEEDAFFAGRVAMQITGPWSYITKSPIPFNAFPIPIHTTPATVTGTGNIFMMKTTSEKQQAALKFLEFIVSQEFQTPWSIGTGFLPVNIKSLNSPEYQDYLQTRPWLKVFLDQIPLAGSLPTIAGFSRISENLGRAIEQTLLGKSSAEVALKQAQERLDVIWGDMSSP